MAMHFTFRIIGGDPGQPYLQGWDPNKVYYYNGDVNEIAYVHNEEELKYLRSTYKETHGIDLVNYVWSVNAPVFIRIFSVLNPLTGGGTTHYMLASLKEKIDEYLDVYWSPKFFTPKVSLHIRNEPSRIGEVLGMCTINRKYRVIETQTQCDWHWAKIDHDGIIGWIAMGDIIGDWYGEKHRN